MQQIPSPRDHHRGVELGGDQARRTGEALQRELLDVGDLPRPSTAGAVASGARIKTGEATNGGMGRRACRRRPHGRGVLILQGVRYEGEFRSGKPGEITPT